MGGFDLRTPEGITRLRQARDAFLSDPAVGGELPERLSTAWRRALFLGVEPDRRTVPAVPVAPDSPLLVAATPVLDRLTSTLAGTDVAVVLTDTRAHVLGCWTVGDRMRAHLDRIQTRQGADLSEPATGNNGISEVLETRRSGLVKGPEHIFGLYQQTVCAGAPVRHPVTRHVDGAVALVCDLDSPPVLLSALADAAVVAIEDELLHNASPHERVLVDAYLQAAAGARPVVVVDGRTRIVSPAAAALLSEQDLCLLEARAADAVSGRAALAGDAAGQADAGTSGRTVHLRPVIHGGRTCGVVATLLPGVPDRPAGARAATPPATGSAALPGLVGASPAWRRTVQATTALRRPGVRALLTGEPGTGKTAVALALAGGNRTAEAEVPADPPAAVPAARPADVPVLDAALAGDGWPAWVRELRSALSAGGAVVVRHLDAVPEPAVDAVLAAAAAAPDTRILATGTAGGERRPAVGRLLAHWAAQRVVIPPLRDRATDVPELVRVLSLRVPGSGGPLTFTLEAGQALLHYRWPANVAELAALVRQLVAEHGTARPIGLDALPSHISSCSRGRALSGIESAEYAAIRDALQHHGGNRLRAAKSLGIARATLYRKLRQYGLEGTAGSVQRGA